MVKLHEFSLIFWCFGIIIYSIIYLSQLLFLTQFLLLDYTIVSQPEHQQKLLNNCVVLFPQMCHFWVKFWRLNITLI